MRKMRVALVVALAAACSYQPVLRDCTVRCADQAGCPPGHSCHSDGFCHQGQPGDVVAACVSQPDAASDAPKLVDALGDGATTPDGLIPDGVAPDAGAPADAAVCAGYTLVASVGRRYKAATATAPLALNEARATCSSSGGYMASLNSAAENTAVRSFMTAPAYYFVGAFDFDGDDTFAWADGTTMIFANWASGRPIPGVEGPCVQVAGDGTWYDADCGGPFSFACECNE